MNYVIDLSNVSDRARMHAVLSDVLSLPAYYGRNLDALWDCLTSDLQTPCEIRLILSDTTPYADALQEIFERAQAWHLRCGHELKLTIERR